jgi:hypothetical protein
MGYYLAGIYGRPCGRTGASPSQRLDNRSHEIRCRSLLVVSSPPLSLSRSTLTPPEMRAYRNPILPGFNPDPTIIRVGDDYFLVTSSFEYFPGIPLYHSQNLIDWKRIGHVLTRPSQLDLRPCPSSGGIFAPTLRHHNGRFYVTVTAVHRARKGTVSGKTRTEGLETDLRMRSRLEGSTYGPTTSGTRLRGQIQCIMMSWGLTRM